MTVGEAVAKRIEEVLMERKMSLYRLAKEACIPIATLQNLYRGHTKSPTFTVILKICDALNMTIAEFIDCPYFNLENLELY